jgi:hypothetical protein
MTFAEVHCVWDAAGNGPRERLFHPMVHRRRAVLLLLQKKPLWPGPGLVLFFKRFHNEKLHDMAWTK